MPRCKSRERQWNRAGEEERAAEDETAIHQDAFTKCKCRTNPLKTVIMIIIDHLRPFRDMYIDLVLLSISICIMPASDRRLQKQVNGINLAMFGKLSKQTTNETETELN